MKNNKKWSVRAVALTAVLLISASSASASSIYSRFGIGLVQHFSLSRTIGMGGVGIATLSSSALPYMNSAALPYITGTRFDGSLRYENANINFPNNEGSLANASFNSFQVVFPVKKGYGLGIGLQPYSVVSFRISQEVEFPGSTSTATESLTGIGGLQRGFVHFGGTLGKHFSYGAGMNVFFGGVEKTWRVIPTDDSFSPTRDITNSHIRGLGWNTGLVFRANNHISLGAVFQFPTSLGTRTRVEYATGRITPEVTSDTKLPFSHGYGFYLVPTTKWRFGGEVYLQNWSDVESQEIFESTTVNTRRISAGFGYTPSNKPFSGFFERMTYSAGLILAKLPYTETGASVNEIQERLLTLGMAVPFNANRGKLDFGIAIGKRGSLDKNSAEETIFQFTAAVTGGEIWFIRRRR